jgi:AcrR family transcriptional regulator
MANDPAREPEMQQLRRGKHGLSAEEVSSQQRGRVLRAMIYAVAERGYGETRVADVIERAGVSRKTFYELFEDKEACFLAAYDVVLGMLLGATTHAFESDSGRPWAERASDALEALLNTISEHPETARFAIVEVMAAGEKALARRDAAMRQFTGLIDTGRAESSVALPAVTSLALVGGIYELLYTEILHGAESQLPARLADLVYWVTLPYLGEPEAEQARRRARERRSDGDRDRSGAAGARTR